MEDKIKESSKSLISSISPIVPKKIDVVLKRNVRWVIMIIFILLNMIMMIDTGLFSSASTKIKETLNINDEKFGLFGSCNHTGRILGTITFMLVFNFVHRKKLMLVALYIHCLSIFLFTVIKIVPLLFFSRILNGFCSTFGFVYFPIWIDQFGIQKKKTVMMSYIQMASPLGMVLGYTMNTIIGSDKWKTTLLIESISLFTFLSFLLFIPKKYFSRKLTFKQHFEGEQIKKLTKISKIKIKNKNNSDNLRIRKDVSRPSLFGESNQENKNELFSFGKKLKYVLTNKIFISTVLYKSTNNFICSGTGFWLSDYVENILGEKNSYNRLYSYIIIIVIGPVIGMVMGGLIGSLAGGYEKKQSVLLIFIIQIICSISSIFVPLANSLFYFILFLSLFNMLLSAVVPINAGLILWSLPKSMKGFGNGIGTLITTFLGKLPAPFLYGYLQFKFMDINKKIGMILLMSVSFLGTIFLGFVSFFRYKDEYILIAKAEDENEKENKKDFGQQLRQSLNSEVISSVFNNEENTINNEKSFHSDSDDNEEKEIELDSVYSYKTDSSKETFSNNES